ncbi:MAG: hypothetical protein ACXW30_02270 [Micavibrio sp.]
MIKTRLSTFVLILSAGLSLSACDTVQTGMNNGYASVKQAMQNFRPLENLQPSPAPTQIAQTSSLSAPGCPTVRIVQDLNQVHQFVDSGNPDPAHSVSSIRMTNVQDQCALVKDNMVIDMTLAFEGHIGPKARAQSGDKPGFAYPYFIAITNNQGNIIAKEVFAVTLAYESGRDTETHVEQVRQMIPVAGLNPDNYKVLIGFQLSEEELAFNRALPPEQSMVEPAAGD